MSGRRFAVAIVLYAVLSTAASGMAVLLGTDAGQMVGNIALMIACMAWLDRR